ncbi:MAG: hypothetical protein LJE95_14320 [Acidobacteria bacterium]|nr:hypothetical protein [Acidobacteriota bacterium]
MIHRVVLIAGCMMGAIGTVSPPPAVTLNRIEAAMRGLDSAGFRGSYVVTTRSVVSKPSGSKREETVTVVTVTDRRGSEPEKALVRAERNGKDVTVAMREKLAKKWQKESRNPTSGSSADRSSGNEEDGHSTSLTLPGAAELAAYRFTPVTNTDSVVVVKLQAEDDTSNSAGSGRMAWNPTTLDPLWLEFTPHKNPRFIKAISLRVEFARAGRFVYPERMVTDGRGGMLFIKRTFHVETKIDGLKPAEGSS